MFALGPRVRTIKGVSMLARPLYVTAYITKALVPSYRQASCFLSHTETANAAMTCFHQAEGSEVDETQGS